MTFQTDPIVTRAVSAAAELVVRVINKTTR